MVDESREWRAWHRRNENRESEQLSNRKCPSCSIINDCDGNHRLSRDLNEDIVRTSQLKRVEASGFSRPVQLYVGWKTLSKGFFTKLHPAFSNSTLFSMINSSKFPTGRTILIDLHVLCFSLMNLTADNNLVFSDKSRGNVIFFLASSTEYMH